MLEPCHRWIGGLGTKRGVGGIGNFKKVKCLHTHTAHYLAGPEGEWVVL
jgi:hypothetical protein